MVCAGETMKVPAYVQQNHYGIYHFRRAIPLELRSIIGKREITKSLQTRNPKKAIQLARFVAFQVDKMFGELKTDMSKKNKTIRTDYTFELSIEPDGTRNTKTEASLEELEMISKLTPEQISALHGTQNNTSPIPNQAHQSATITIVELIDKFKEDYLAREGKSIIDNDNTAFRRLSEIMGATTSCTELTIELAHEVRETIMKLPKYSKKFDSLHILKIIEQKHEQTIAPITIANHIKTYSRLFKWAKKKRYYFDEDPFEDLVPKFKRGGGRDFFEEEDLTAIFSGHVFTDFNPHKDKPHHYWAPLIGLFTGARISEIGALRLDDFILINGHDGGEPIWVIHFNTHNGEDRMKTEDSERHTPIHPELIELGIIDYYQHQMKLGKTRLFDYLNKNSKGSYGRWIGEDFTNYLKDIGIHKELRKVFHSFRHTIASALERVEVSDARIELISGRTSSEKPTTGRKHYISTAEANYLLRDLMKISFSKHLEQVKAYKNK